MRKNFYQLGLLALFLVLPARAASLLIYEIEPIVGYERTQKLVPTRHTKDRLLYGARMTFGVPLIAGELEYTRATDNEDFPDDLLTTKDTEDRVKLGLKSQIRLGATINAFARAGGQASRNIHEETLNGVASKVEEPIKYKPYAGAGFTGKLGRHYLFTAGITVVFKEFPVMDKNEYQATAGFVVRFP